MNKSTDAEEVLKQALQIYEENYDLEHPLAKIVLYNLIQVASDSDRLIAI